MIKYRVSFDNGFVEFLDENEANEYNSQIMGEIEEIEFNIPLVDKIILDISLTCREKNIDIVEFIKNYTVIIQHLKNQDFQSALNDLNSIGAVYPIDESMVQSWIFDIQGLING